MGLLDRLKRIHTWQLLFSLAAVLAVYSRIATGSDLDIHLHDTYFVVAYSHVMLALAVILAFFGLMYYALKTWLPVRLLSWLHVLLTTIPILLICMPIRYEGFADTPRRYYDYSAWDSFQSFGMLHATVSIAVIVCFLAQTLFLLNLIMGLVFKITRRT